jgi:hypothetical protein
VHSEAFEEFEKDFFPKAVARSTGQLYNYMKALQTLKWHGGMVKVAKASKELARS